MNSLENCPNCGALFVRTKFRDVCDACYKEEEAQFEKVYQFIRKTKNRTATLTEVVEGTGVEEELVLKFIKTGRLRTAHYPNLGYPCEKCGTIIKTGRLCGNCADSIRSDLDHFEKETQHQQELKDKKTTYFTKDL